MFSEQGSVALRFHCDDVFEFHSKHSRPAARSIKRRSGLLIAPPRSNPPAKKIDLNFDSTTTHPSVAFDRRKRYLCLCLCHSLTSAVGCATQSRSVRKLLCIGFTNRNPPPKRFLHVLTSNEVYNRFKPCANLTGSRPV